MSNRKLNDLPLEGGHISGLWQRTRVEAAEVRGNTLSGRTWFRVLLIQNHLIGQRMNVSSDRLPDAEAGKEVEQPSK